MCPARSPAESGPSGEFQEHAWALRSTCSHTWAPFYKLQGLPWTPGRMYCDLSVHMCSSLGTHLSHTCRVLDVCTLSVFPPGSCIHTVTTSVLRQLQAVLPRPVTVCAEICPHCRHGHAHTPPLSVWGRDSQVLLHQEYLSVQSCECTVLWTCACDSHTCAQAPVNSGTPVTDTYNQVCTHSPTWTGNRSGSQRHPCIQVT